MPRPASIMLLLLLLPTTVRTDVHAQTQKKTVAVLEFNSSSSEVGKNELTTLTNRFRTILVKTNVYDVLERQKMGDILKEQDFTLSDACNSAECAVQVGQLLGVEYMIAGDVGKLGGTYSVDLRLISVSTGQIVQSESQDHEGKIDGLLGAMTRIGDSFAGIKSESQTEEPILNRPSEIHADSFMDPRDGRIYKTVQIAGKTWMAENLDYVPVAGRYCYGDNGNYCVVYGGLYTWEAARNAVPPGWHLPTDDEWIDLMIELGENQIACKLKEAGADHWNIENVCATNETGFTALPGGIRSPDGTSGGVGWRGIWWSANEASANEAWNWEMWSDKETMFREGSINKANACSVRCVKD